MKKIFTLALALMSYAGVVNAATVDDIAPLKHSYVLVCDELGSRPGKGVLFGNDHFLDVKSGGTTATNKGTVDLSVAGGNEGYVTEEIAAKYGADYGGPHYNWLRLKNQQDMIALKLTAGSKIIIFEQGNNKSGKDARIPRISTDEAQANSLNAAPGEDHPSTVSGYRWEFTVDDDGLYYLGSYNGDMFVSFIIVEANEAPGTPSVKVGPQTYENELWFREVSCTRQPITLPGSDESIPTVVTYTTDGSAPTAASPIYTAPIKVYQDAVVKFQAFMDFGDGQPSDDLIQDGADNEAGVNFVFDAPSISVDGANVSIISPYTGAVENYYSLNGGEDNFGDNFTIEESATITAYSKIINGGYGVFTTKSSSTDALLLNPLKEDRTITVSGTAVVDEENSTEDAVAWKVEGGEISADKFEFFAKNLTFGVVKDAEYQVPNGNEVYILMSNTNLTFQVAAGDSVDVVVTCSKNSCKNIDAADAEDGSAVADRQCYVNVSGTNYGGEDLKLNPDGNVIKFGLAGGDWKSNTDADGNTTTEFVPALKTYTFQKYSGTGNIKISSIRFTPILGENAITSVAATEATDNVIYNMAGQKVSAAYKGVVIKNGQKMIQK